MGRRRRGGGLAILAGIEQQRGRKKEMESVERRRRLNQIMRFGERRHAACLMMWGGGIEGHGWAGIEGRDG